MLVEALEFRCPTKGCVNATTLVRYRPNCLYGYHPSDLPNGIKHREWESHDPTNTPADGFVLASSLFCRACGARMRRL
jgi:hypothetical protein